MLFFFCGQSSVTKSETLTAKVGPFENLASFKPSRRGKIEFLYYWGYFGLSFGSLVVAISSAPEAVTFLRDAKVSSSVLNPHPWVESVDPRNPIQEKDKKLEEASLGHRIVSNVQFTFPSPHPAIAT
jgi:hypothetical protein